MIVPRPVRLEPLGGSFDLTPATALYADPGAEPAATLLRGALAATGLTLPPSTEGRVRLELRDGHGSEGYRLHVRADGVTLRATTAAGLLHGVQTLRQLLPAEALRATPAPGTPWRLPRVLVEDAPRFAWRGFMLDVARHFQPLPFLYRLVDALALHKLNVLHLHLTDDQGWRVEIDRYPALTEVGAWRPESMVGPAGSGRRDGTPHGGFYTKAELRALVAHARDRGVRIVPEIAMPGHARAALAAHPEFGNDPARRLPVWTDWGISDHVFGVHDDALDFCRAVLDEVMDVFPDPHVHLGGDECPPDQWRASPLARARAAELGLAGPERLYEWFLGQMCAHVLGAGRRPVCWDEAAARGVLDPEVTVMAWRDPAHGSAAARRGHPVVMAPWRHTYLDYRQRDDPAEPPGQPGPALTLSDVHAFDPVNGDAPPVLGVQAQLWTEFVTDPGRAEYLIFPRLCALAEVGWSPAPRDGGDFLRRLTGHRARLDALGVRHALRDDHAPGS